MKPEPEPQAARRPWAAFALMALLALLAFAAYSPGLRGGFLFDDFVNLDAIGATGPVDNLATLLRYATSGTADPTGRPLALLSFLVDARDWPAEPGPFLRSNLLLHLLNGLLLWRLLAGLGREPAGAAPHAQLAAALGAGLWLLHPLFVSTTLYVVQREAMLPATFVLAGLLCWLHGRRRWFDSDGRDGGAWMVAGIVGGTGLAVACKANGALLPLLALVLDACLPARPGQAPPKQWRTWRALLLGLPSLLVLAYLASFLAHPNANLVYRGWSTGERLLTQGRVLVDYLQLLVVPRSVSTGLYNDSYVVSRGLLSPWSTLPCLLLVIALPAAAFAMRRRTPALSAALLFFFAGHLLESSVVPLELYFEHRNYLPAMLLGWPVARALLAPGRGASLRAFAAIALVMLLAATTWQRADLWGQPERMALLWARQNPGSSRAQATMAMMDVHANRPEAALARLDPILAAHPYDLQIALNATNAACASTGLSPARAAALEASFAGARESLQLVPGWMARMLDAAEAGQCAGLDLAVAQRWIEAFARNPKVAGAAEYVQDVEPLRAQLALAQGDGDAARRHFDAAFLAWPTPDVAARQAAMLASRGHYTQALKHLDLYERERGRLRPPARGMPRVHAWILEKQGYWPHEMAVLRAKLRAELAGANARTPQT